MVLIRTSSVISPYIDVAEMKGPAPGFVWLMPHTLSLRFDKMEVADPITKKTISTFIMSNTEVSDSTVGLSGKQGQGRGLVDARSALQAGTQSHAESDDDLLSMEDRINQVADAVMHGRLTQRRGQQLPTHFLPPNDTGFTISVTDAKEFPGMSRSAAGQRRPSTSTVRIAKEAWLRISRERRIKLLPWLEKEDPLWSPRGVRYWMNANCIPFFYDQISVATSQRPRALRLAIPIQEPWHSEAIRILQSVFSHEARSRRSCPIQRPKAMSIPEAGLILGIVPLSITVKEVDGSRTEGVNTLLAAEARKDQLTDDFGRGVVPTAAMIAASIRESHANPFKFTKRQRDAAKNAKNAGIKISIKDLEEARAQHFKKYDPDQAEPEEGNKEDDLYERQKEGEDAYERIMLGRFLRRNIIMADGPALATTRHGERIEGFRQAMKILRYDPVSDRMKLIRDSAWVWRHGTDTKFEIIQDDAGNFNAEESIIPMNLKAWVAYLWPRDVEYEKSTPIDRLNWERLSVEDRIDLVDADEVESDAEAIRRSILQKGGGSLEALIPHRDFDRLDLTGWRPLAARILYGRI